MTHETNQKDAIIKIQGLEKTFHANGNAVKVLENIDLDIYTGEIFGIIGMSGAGKSTLVRCINFLEKPTKGTVIFDGEDLSKQNARALNKARQAMGMIFQQFNLLMQRNALGNVCFPLEIAGIPKAKARQRATELLELVGLTDKATAYPAQLSGGQKQRIAIARALANNPKALLCDEATSALDPTTTRSLLSLLKDINQRLSITIVIITHEMGVIEEICHRVAIIDNRRIAEVGNVAEIFANPQTHAAKKLVYPDGKRSDFFSGRRQCRIVFDGRSSYEPIIANMVLTCKQAVNIIFADTQDIDGKAFGQMVIQLPDDESASQKILSYLKTKGVAAQEVENHV